MMPPPPADPPALHLVPPAMPPAWEGQEGEPPTPPPEDTRPAVVVGTELAEVVDAAETALLGANCGIYVRAGLLVRIQRDGARFSPGISRTPDAPILAPVPREWLRETLARGARWRKWRPKPDGTMEMSPIVPPPWVGETLLVRGEWPFPIVEGVTETPLFCRDGEILAAPGYHSPSALLYEPDSTFARVPDKPTRSDAEAALAVVGELFSDFPFLAACDRSASIALMLSILARPAIRGPVPMFVVRAPVPGAGKGLLVDAATLAILGRAIPRMTAPRDDDEARKRLLGIGLSGVPAVLVDNIDGALGGASLAAALTAETFSDRLLSVNRMVTVPLRAVWAATGNNVAFKGDLGRRVIPIDLDPRCEHPEDRDGFAHADLRAYARDRRAVVVAACLTILRAYHLARRPPHGEPRKGSFEDWDDLVRGAILWAGAADPLAGCQRIREEGDSDLDALRAVIGGWFAAFGGRNESVAGAIDEATRNADLRATLATLDPKSDGQKLHGQAIGKALRRMAGRYAGGQRMERGPDLRGNATWRVAGEGK